MELHLNDDDGAELNLSTYDADHLILGVYSNRRNARIKLDASGVDKLWARLGEWRNQGSAPTDPELIYEALVRRLVAEEVARVLPLHQSPQAAVERLANALVVPPEAVHEYATNTGLPLCIDHNCREVRDHAEHDPEPQAVGHPEAPAVDWSDKLFGCAEYPEGLKFDYCTSCGHSWGAHLDENGCHAQLGKNVCECTRVRGES